MKQIFLSTAFALLLTGAAKAGPLAQPVSVHNEPSRVTSYSFTLAPLPFVKFCMQRASECEAVAGTQQPTSDMISRMAEINREVNRSISPMRKPTQPLLTNWTIAPEAGDCNDYAVTKRHKLIAAGWPSNRVLLAAVATPEGQGHLVLVVRTAEGDLVLDNLTDAIRRWDKTPFDWISMQSEDDPRFWVAAGERGRQRQQRLQAVAESVSVARQRF